MSQPTHETFDTTVSAVFEVNKETRTLRGLLLPFGVVGENGSGRFQFDAEAEYSWPADLTRLKLFSAHDYSRPIGYATQLAKTPKGIEGAFKIGRGASGDQALIDAEDHVADGFSVGLGTGPVFEIRDGVRHGKVVPIREVSQTPLPAFDDARVTSVAASAVPNGKEPTNMGNEDPTKVEAPPALDPKAVFDAIAGLAAKVEQFTGVPPREPNPTALPKAGAEVREELPYRFDGVQGGKFSLLDDAKSIQFAGDSDAAQRMETFLGESFAAIAVADVATLNPAQSRPGMYVGPLRFNRPLWSLVNRDSITDNTPFFLPKFGTKTGKGIQAHVSGNEPAEMGLTTGSQTITPAPLSGLAKIVREVYDQSTNPSLDKIIWDEMMADYFEGLEVAIAALLAAGTGTEINVGAGATDAAKVALLKAALVQMQFVKGGDRFSAFAADPTLYGGCSGAVDTTGRPLLPTINATNADGVIRSGYEAIQLGNRTLTPSWALDKAVSNAEVSYLFAPESVHAYVSAPKRINIEMAVKEVQIGIWGYSATALTRATDVIPVDWTTADA